MPDRTEIVFVRCPHDDTKATSEEPEYRVRRLSEVIFDNQSGGDFKIKFEGCSIFQGDPEEIELVDGQQSEPLTVKDDARPCQTELEPECPERAGPIIIPEP
jgi:hypothetical protein